MAGRHQQLFQWNANEPVEPKGMIGGFIPVYEKKQRDRSWEQGNNQTRATYRGVPQHLTDEIRNIALSLQVNTGDVARAFLEFGLHCANEGELRLVPKPKAQRMTLFPTDGKSLGWKDQQSWTTGKIQSTSSKSGKKNVTEAWRTLISYRGIPLSLQEQIKEQAGLLTIPQGELVTVFFQYALHAYELGRLSLTPLPGQGRQLHAKWGVA